MDFYRFFGAYSLIVIFLVVNERTIYLHEKKLSDLIDLYTLQLVGNAAPEHEPVKNQKDEVISIISAFSQEVRTPLIAVLGFTRFLEHRIAADLDEKCLQALQLTIKNAEDLVSFSSDLLEIETMKYGEIKDRFEDVNLNVLMDEVVQSLLPLAQLKEITIVKQFFHVVNIEGNRIKLKQAFINLISNSIKYTREGKIIVQLDIRENLALVVITDSGIGMTTAQLSKLFEGLQNFSAESVRLGSTGLGLTIAKEIFNYHNGVIEASSKKNEGSVFTVNLPLRQ
jgi:signal transduction histidine kinase